METLPLNTEYFKIQASNHKFEALNNLKTISNNSDKQEINKAARGFESMFISIMMKEMKNAMIENNDDDSGFTFGADTLLDYTDLIFADHLSQTQTGIGLAQMIYKHLTGGDELQPLRIIYPKNQEILKITPNSQQINNTLEKNFEKYNNLDATNNNPSSNNNNFIERVNKRIKPYLDFIENISQQFGIPSKLIKSIITAESAGITNAVSSAGAKGLMQLMDSTAKDMGVYDSFNPYDNILGGTKYIFKMLNLFDGDLELALAGYNAGPGNVIKYGAIPPFKETQNYVQKVIKYLDYFD